MNIKNKIKDLLSKIKIKLPTSVSPRFIPYAVLFSILITLVVVFLPQFINQVALLAFSWMPPQKKIFSTHQILCDEAITEITTMNALRKQKLVIFMKNILEQGPTAIDKAREANWSINLLAQQLASDNEIPVLTGNSFGDAYAEVCFGRAISALGTDATPLLPLLFKGQDTQLVHSITKNNSEAVELAWQEILASAEDPQLFAESEKWWKVLWENKELAWDPVFQLFSKGQDEQNNPQLQARAKTFLRQSLMQMPGSIPDTMAAFLLNSENNQKVVAKKLELLEMLLPINYFSRAEGRDLIQQLLTNKAPEITLFAEKLFFQRRFQEQKELDYFVAKFTPIIHDLDLTKNLGWQQLKEFQRLALLTFPPASHQSKPSALDYGSLEILMRKLLEKIALQVGYQTSTFSDLTNQLLKTELAPSLAHYFVSLMKEKKDQDFIVPYLLRIPDWDEELIKTLAQYLQQAPSEQKKSILAILQGRQLLNNNANLAPEAALGPLINILFTLLTKNEDRIVNSAFQILARAQAPLLPNILMRLKQPNISDEEKLALLRLQWQISSTSEVASSLEQALLKANECHFHFVQGFSELLVKKADLPPATSGPSEGKTFQSPIDHYYEDDDVTPVAKVFPVSAIVYPKLNPLLVQKYVTCPLDYLNLVTAQTLANYSPAFKKIIESYSQKQQGDLKKFWRQALGKK